jgi:predicted ATP-grasp superfamily ATP-dependent carboligase
MDVVRALYMDLTGQKVGSVIPKEGRRWVIENYDLEAALDYYKEGTLEIKEWLRSFKGVEETAWFSWRDPTPFLIMCMSMTKKVIKWLVKKLGMIQKQK